MIKNRYAWVDIAKGFGIFLVVLAHTYRGVTAAGIKGLPILEIIDSIIYTFHMPLFFFVSGLFFISSLNKRSGTDFLKNKIGTIAYPYLLWGTLQGLMIAYFASKGVANQEIKFVEVFQFWKPLGQFWFLYELFFILIISAFLYHFNFFNYLPQLIFFSIFLYLFKGMLAPNFIVKVLSSNWIFFLAGVLFMKHSRFLENIKATHILITFLLFLLLQAYFHLVLKMTYEDKGVLTLVLGLLSIFFVVISAYKLSGKTPDWIVVMGQHSMAIYLLHVFFASGFRMGMHNILHINNLWVLVLFGTFFGIALPLFIGLYVQKNKIPGIFSINFK